MFISIICTWCFFLFGCVYGNSSVYPISRPHIPAAGRRINGYVQWFGYAIAVSLIIYTLIRIRNIIFYVKKVKGMNGDEYESKYKEMRKTTLRNMILAFLIIILSTILSMGVALVEEILYLKRCGF